MLEWASRARGDLLVAHAGLATERDKVVREATELVASVLGEPLPGPASPASASALRSTAPARPGGPYTPAVASLEASPLEQPLEWDTPLFLMARAQFEQALPYADVSPMVAERLSFPERALIVSVPLRRDDGTMRDLRRLPRPALDACSGRRRAASATTRRSRSASAPRSRRG